MLMTVSLSAVGGFLQIAALVCAMVVGTCVEQGRYTFGHKKERKNREIGMFFLLAVAFWAIGALLIGGAH